jgi:hypothetical protein
MARILHPLARCSDLLAQRGKFLAARVDGIFRALSREHVTNRPEDEWLSKQEKFNG